MKDKILRILLLVFIVGLAILLGNSPKQEILDIPASNQLPEVVNVAQGKLETKIDEQASVVVSVTPTNISSQAGEWKFDVIMDTHSVELDQDMTKISVLIDDQGKEYKPLRWEGAEAGGHHREGTIIFKQIVPIPKFVEIRISDIGDVKRSFLWQL